MAKKRNAAERIAEGQRLLKVKATMKHGEWLVWLKANIDVTVATAQRYMREAKPQAQAEAQAKADLASAWAQASMEERCRWLSEQDRMFDALYKRVKDQDAVMARRGQPKGSYRYM